MAQIPSDPELGPFESALAKLTPARSLLDRDRLMFQAGALSARAGSRRRWAWPAIAAVLGLVAVSESIALAVRPAREVVVRESPPPARDRTSESGIEILAQSESATAPKDLRWEVSEPLRQRRQLFRHGLEGLPDPPPLLSQSGGPVAGGPSTEPLRRYELNRVLNLGGPS